MVEQKTFLVKLDKMGDRLDVSYFVPEIMENLKQLKELSVKLVELQDLCQTINRGKQPKYNENGDVPIIKTIDISKEGIIDWNNTLKTDFDFFDGNLSAQIKQGDILLTSTGVGSLGKLTIIEEKREAVVDGHITIIRGDEKLIYQRFVFIFLKSKLGNVQIERNIRGSTGQIEIYPTDIKSILVPIPSREVQEKVIKLFNVLDKKRLEIKKTISNSSALMANLINEGYEKIMEFLEINYPKIDGDGNLLIVPEFKITDRLDFIYHKKDCTKMISEIKSSKTPDCQLKDMVEFRKEKVDIKNNLDTTFNYSAISDIDNGRIHNFTPLTGRELPSRAKNVVKVGDILMPLLWTSREKVAIVQEGCDDFIVSTGFAVGKPKVNTSLKYLYLMLKSKYMQKQIEQRNTGGIMESITVKELGEITLPCPDIVTQERCLEIFGRYKKKAKEVYQESINLSNQLRGMENKFEDNLIKLLNK